MQTRDGRGTLLTQLAQLLLQKSWGVEKADDSTARMVGEAKVARGQATQTGLFVESWANEFL